MSFNIYALFMVYIDLFLLQNNLNLTINFWYKIVFFEIITNLCRIDERMKQSKFQ